MRIQETVTVAVMALMLTLMSPTAYAQEKESDDWKYRIIPYLWAVGLDGDMVVGGQPVEIDIDFDELLDEVEFAGEVHFEATKNRWSWVADTTIIKIDSEQQAGPFTAEVEMDYVLAEFFVGYRIAPKWDLIGGVRYWLMDVDLDIQGPIPPVDEDESWLDLIVGARYFTDISEKWTFAGRADIGGFDIGESADSTWNVSALFFRDYGRKGNKQFIAGYRILDVDFDEGSGTSQFKFDIEQSGPLFGASFTW